MKKILFTTFCCLLIVMLGTGCGSKNKTGDSKTAETTTETPKPAKDKYVKLAKEINAKMPAIFSGGLRMDRVEAVSEDEFRYVFTFTKDPAVSAEEFTRSSKLALSMGISNGKQELETLRKDKMTITYAYYKMDGSLFSEIKITPQDYLK